MKSLPLVAAVILGLTFAAHADPVTTPADPAKEAPQKAADKPAEEAGKAAKPIPMNRPVDSIDAAAKTFSRTTKKGVKVTEKITDKTVIMQGDKPALFSDIKVGDTVSGTHLKISDNTFEVVKITKFGPAAPKAAKAAPTADEKKD